MAMDLSHANDSHTNDSHLNDSYSISSHPNDACPNGPHPHGDGERVNFTLRVGGSSPERVIFFLNGDLLGPACLAFERFTHSCIDGGTRRLRLDLAELRSLDLDGVDTLVTLHQRLSTLGGRLLLTNANPDVISVLQVFGRPLLATDTAAVFTPAGGRPGERAVRRLAG